MVNNKLSFDLLKEKISKKYYNNNQVLGECALSNNQRLYYLALIAIPIRILILLTFEGSYDTLALRTWSIGILSSHIILLIFMIIFLLMSIRLKKRSEANKTIYALTYVAIVVIMGAGIVIVTFDQIITSNITPFIITCIITGLVFLVRPLISILYYVISYLFYSYLIGLTISNPQILLSNRLNGITAVGIGFLLSIILWNYNYKTIIQERQIADQQKQLEQLAYYDPLTELPNRRLFSALLKKEVSSMLSYDHESVIIMLDIDDFKKINDTYGHSVGDKALIQLADIIKASIRESDIVSRFGGEEFMILLPQTSLEGGYLFAERLRKLIMVKELCIDSIIIQITISSGVSSLPRIKSENIEYYYQFADKALYLAKNKGKNRVEVVKE